MIKSKEERYETFIEWTTFTDDRVVKWKKTIPNEISSKLDWSPESLPVLEKYAMSNYSIEDQKDKEKRPALDAIASYIGDVFRRNIPETVWKIDVEDETNVYYNLPYLVFKLGAPMSPHHLLQDALFEKSGTRFSVSFQKMMKRWEQYKAYMESKK